MAANARIRLRRDTATNWTSANPVLELGELGYETDTGRMKAGDGSTAWSSLAYYSSWPGFSIGLSGVPGSSMRYPIQSMQSFTATTSGSSATALVAATASTVFTLKKGTVASPTTMGTFTFSASATTATVSITSGAISSGDMVWIEAPSSVDATLADLSFVIRR